MKKHWKFIEKSIVFLCVLCICVKLVFQLIVPKFFRDNAWPTTSTYLGFYQMAENSIDVLCFGSSHAASFFLPQELYNICGIRSYNLGCEQQNLITSYFWLKEALRFQKPKVVLLDCYILFEYRPEEPLNSAESCTRKAFDYMHWSSVKKDAVKTICKLDENQSELSYYLPNIRYHTRWKELSENDFTYAEKSQHYELKGYAPFSHYGRNQNFVPFECGVSEEKIEMVPLMKEYLEKITQLCAQEDISLILIKTPSTYQNIGKHNTIEQYATEHKLAFLDFNEKAVYEECNYCFAQDNSDDGHGNLWGAQKVTNYIGKFLIENNNDICQDDWQWERTKSCYEEIKKDYTLIHTTDIDTYLTLLQDTRYTIFISVRDECADALKDTTLNHLKNLGLEADLKGKFRYSYLAVLSNGVLTEQLASEKIEFHASLENNSLFYTITSAGFTCGNISSIIIDGAEKSKNGRGINIVVYCNDTRKVIDSVCFDTHTAENMAYR